uniref:Aspartate aminotransferase (AspB) n=1 Tax=uncultured marine thaumarchaeote KM3_68_B04 TaxID=1456242 RepID=A0A075HLP0_9ARCH|nr:aspartate aminotransferase (aspB) [uncultured marine thaumarchaeote KM3_68_B04]
MVFADRVFQVSSSQTQAVTAAAAKLREQGVDVIDLGAGEPDFRTPTHIGDAGINAIREGFTKYTLNSGTKELRRAICSWYERRYDVSFPLAQCLVCAGGKQGLFNTAMCLFRQGDEVITHSPAWPSIVEQIKLFNATPVLVRTSSEAKFKVDASSILDAVTENTRAIILNSPCNPTGAVISEATVETIAKETEGTGIWLVLDLCYEQLIYDHQAHNLPLKLTSYAPERSVLIGSASKSYAMISLIILWNILILGYFFC